MGISWTDAVRDADDADDWGQLRRAIQQTLDLEPLIHSFARAIRDVGKWPRRMSCNEWSHQWEDLGPDFLDTRAGRVGDLRGIVVREDASWFIEIAYGDARDKGIEDRRIAFGNPGAPPRLSSIDDNLFVASRGFTAHIAEVEQAKDWVPRELVAFLRAKGIPIPQE